MLWKNDYRIKIFASDIQKKIRFSKFGIFPAQFFFTARIHATGAGVTPSRVAVLLTDGYGQERAIEGERNVIVLKLLRLAKDRSYHTILSLNQLICSWNGHSVADFTC